VWTSLLIVAAVALLGFLMFAMAPAETAVSAQPLTSLPPWEHLSLEGGAVRVLTPPGGALFVRTTTGLFRSDDGGTSWVNVPLPDGGGPLGLSPPASPANIRGSGLLAVHPTDPLTLYAPALGGVARTTDGGASWTTILRQQDGVMAFAVSPADPTLLFATAGSVGASYVLLRNQNGGDTWETLDNPVYDKCIWSTTVLYPDPSDADRLFNASNCTNGRSTGGVLEIRTDRGATLKRRLDLSSDRGRQPVALAGGMPPGRFLLALGDLQALVNQHVSGASVFRSDDDGDTWNEVLWLGSTADTFVRTPSGTPVPNESPGDLEPMRFEVQALVQSRTDPAVAYVGIIQTVPGSLGVERPRLSRILRYTVQPPRYGSQMNNTWRDLAIADQGRLYDLALSVDGQYLYAATDNGLWRLPDPAHQRQS